MKKLLLCVLLIVSIMGSAVGAGNGDGSGGAKDAGMIEYDLYTYYAESGKILTDAAVMALKEMYPNIKINIEHRTDSDGAVLKTRAAVGEMPDLVECSGLLSQTFAQSGDLLPLDDTIASTGFFDKYNEGVFKGKMDPDGKYYAISPVVPENAMFYYNKAVFKELGLVPPKNYEEFLSLVKNINDADIIPLALFAAQKWPGLQIYDLAVVSEEPKGLMGLDDGTTMISDAAYKNGAAKVKGLVDAGFIGRGAFSTNASQAFELFEMGQAAMVFNGAWFFKDSISYGDNVGYFQYNPFANPGEEEAVRWNVSGSSFGPGGYGVSTNADDPELAKEVILQYLLERSKADVRLLGNVNVLKENIQPNSPRSEAYQMFADNIVNYKNSSKYEWGLNNPELIAALEDTSELIYAGAYTADQFIADLSKRMASFK